MIGVAGASRPAPVVWFGFGKHPMFADYFTVGRSTLLSVAFKKWVSLGYERQMAGQTCSGRTCGYRFWSRGDSHQALLLGLLQSSMDSLGRPFPLLFIGNTRLKGWQQHWQNLHQLLAEVWVSLEKLALAKHATVADLGNSLAQITVPELPVVPWRNSAEAMPSAVFYGGCQGQVTTTRFMNPLTAENFIWLWTIGAPAV